MNGQQIAAIKTEPMSLAEAARIKYLDPLKLKFRRAGIILRMTIEGERTVLKVAVSRVFPLTHPERYLSIRDGSGAEVGILKSLEQLADNDRKLVEEDLDRRYFMPAIERITGVIERFGTVEWQVDTDRGKYRLTTRDMRDNVLRLGGGRYIIQDVDDNRYEIADAARLDRTSLARLLRHL
ncbi:MAG: DUF1854 domain-containing protein [bacterium]